jgi:hypothetical protein
MISAKSNRMSRRDSSRTRLWIQKIAAMRLPRLTGSTRCTFVDAYTTMLPGASLMRRSL